jgi:predicted ester cyclase
MEEAMNAIEVTRQLALRNAIEGWGTQPDWRRVWDETCSQDFISHFCGFAEPVQGLDAAKEFNAELFSGFPHLQQEITGIIATATDVIYRHRLTGTHDGVLLGLPATGKPVDISGMTWLRISGGRIVEQWYELNHAELQRQLAVTA